MGIASGIIIRIAIGRAIRMARRLSITRAMGCDNKDDHRGIAIGIAIAKTTRIAIEMATGGTIRIAMRTAIGIPIRIIIWIPKGMAIGITMDSHKDIHTDNHKDEP